METVKAKKTAAFLSVCSNAVLILLKLSVGFLTGSLSIISEALHSLSDIAASFITYISVKKSSEPADKEHPFGHGKFEELSGFFEGLLICAIALFIFYSAFHKLLHPTEQSFETFWGIIVMSFSVIINIFISKFLFKVGTITNSIAIIADAEHLKTDVLSSMAILVGLLAIKITGFSIIDTLLAFVAAIIIITTGLKLTLQTIKNLLDEALPQEDLDILQKTLDKHTKTDIEEVLLLKTRKSGSEKIINLTIGVNCSMTIQQGHDICDKIEDEIMSALKGAKVFIHLEPCKNKEKIKLFD